MARYKKRYLHAILRQEIGWFDTSTPEELCTRFGAAMLAVEEGVGFKIAMGAFDHTRPPVASGAVGLARHGGHRGRAGDAIGR